MDMKKNQHFNPGEIWESIELPDNLDLLIKNSVEEGYKRMQDKKKEQKSGEEKGWQQRWASWYWAVPPPYR